MPPDDNDVLSCTSSLGSNDPLDRDWLSESLNRLAAERRDCVGVVQKLSHPSVLQQRKGDGYCESVPFTIVTWNIWFSHHEWRARLEAAIWETLIHTPDVFCLQEVTTEVHNRLLNCHYLRERYDPTEQQLGHGYDVAIWVKKNDDEDGGGNQRSIRLHNTKTIPLGSIFGRRGLCIDLEISSAVNERNRNKTISRVRVVTAHLESGRENAGVRKVQLNKLFSSIRSIPWNAEDGASGISQGFEDTSILVGDFNFDPAYPENELIETNGCVDVWQAIRPNDCGFTEDTYKNKMRYLAHGKHKQVRFDRIILVPKGANATIIPYEISLLGSEPFDQEQGLWASDHFGLVAHLGLCKKGTDIGPFCAQNQNKPEMNYGYETP